MRWTFWKSFLSMFVLRYAEKTPKWLQEMCWRILFTLHMARNNILSLRQTGSWVPTITSTSLTMYWINTIDMHIASPWMLWLPLRPLRMKLWGIRKGAILPTVSTACSPMILRLKFFSKLPDIEVERDAQSPVKISAYLRQSSNVPPDWKSSWKSFLEVRGVQREVSGRGPRLLRSCVGEQISIRNPSEANFLEVFFRSPELLRGPSRSSSIPKVVVALSYYCALPSKFTLMGLTPTAWALYPSWSLVDVSVKYFEHLETECTKIARFPAAAGAILPLPQKWRNFLRRQYARFPLRRNLASEPRFLLRRKWAKKGPCCGVLCDTLACGKNR